MKRAGGMEHEYIPEMGDIVIYTNSDGSESPAVIIDAGYNDANIVDLQVFGIKHGDNPLRFRVEYERLGARCVRPDGGWHWLHDKDAR